MMRSVCLIVVGAVLAGPVQAGGAADSLSRRVATFQSVGSLDKAAGALASAGKVKIVVDWDRLTEAGLGKGARAVVQGSDATVEELLDQLVLSASEKNVPLGWFVDGPAIRITTRAAIREREQPRQVVPTRPTATTDRPAASARPAVAAAGAGANFKDTPLNEVVKHLRATTGLDIVVNWNALEEVGITKDSPVNLTARNRSAGRVLDLVLADVSGSRGRFERLYYIIDDGVVTISTGSALNTTTKTVVTDIRDLLVLTPNFKGPSLKLDAGKRNSGNNNATGNLGDSFERDTSSGGNRGGESDATAAEQRALLQERIIQAVKDSIGDDMWQPEGRGSIQIVQGRMVITQTPLGFKLLATATR